MWQWVLLRLLDSPRPAQFDEFFVDLLPRRAPRAKSGRMQAESETETEALLASHRKRMGGIVDKNGI